MLSDEQIAGMEERVEYHKENGNSEKWYVVHLDELLADRKELLARIEQLKADRIKFGEWHDKVCADLIDRLKGERVCGNDEG